MTTVDKANNFVIVVERRMTQVYKTFVANRKFIKYKIL